jgi:hypothetical protein
VAFSFRTSDCDIIAHKSINYLKGPRNSDEAHEELDFRRLQAQSGFVKVKQAQIQKLFEALNEIADNENNQEWLIKLIPSIKETSFVQEPFIWSSIRAMFCLYHIGLLRAIFTNSLFLLVVPEVVRF